ncbi:BLUF domain-containing protein [Litorimonas sp. RW-G-Af-16]|uniref:BLUF domain-containing protein n=1 Tax=Litorimonas sp. RW-G-Af-16 TaxID=3241168 RepID=UPI003AAAF15C
MVYQIYFSGHVCRESAAEPVAGDAMTAVKICKMYDVTGLTLFSEGSFMTVIEGPRTAVTAIYEFYRTDGRMSDVKVMVSRESDTREFNDFRIGFRHWDFSDACSGAFQLNERSLMSSLPTNPSTELRVLTNTFARVTALQVCAA